jgi:hypothetical protein
MAAVKITNFLGKAPKISPELLPNTAAQIARNCKLYSGDLIPFVEPVVFANSGRTGTIRTLYALKDPVTKDYVWLSWANVIDIATPSASDDEEQRFYYTGDGKPKVSTYDLATSGTVPYPNGYYDLGLPLPTQKLTTSAASFTTKTSSSFARDAGNIVTLVTSAAHGLKSGTSVTVSGFSFRTGTYSQSGTTVTVTLTGHGLASGATVVLDFTSGTAVDGTFAATVTDANTFTVVASASATTTGDVRLDIRSLNATNVSCTVINSTTITYFSPGPQITTTSNSDGKLDIGGLTQARSYVYTWFTPWDEESIASKPSDDLFIKEGQVVTVTNIPTAKPTGDNFVRGVRLYRTLPAASGTDYFLLSTLWFPTRVVSGSRTANVSRVRTEFPHNFGVDDRFKISGASTSSFNITDGIVTDIINDYTFEYAQVAADQAQIALTTGDVYHDVSEDPPTSAAVYWGDAGNFDFVDDFDSRALTIILESDNYEQPPEDLQGLVAIQNNILAGFSGNVVYFSEPGVFHAWPSEYAITLEHNIVGLASISGFLLVLTDAYPYSVSGSDPATFSQSRIDANYPCLNRRSIVNMGFGIVYATHEGLAVFSPSVGPAIITKLLYNSDTWRTDLDPSTLVATFYNDNYFASHSTGAITYERDGRDQNVGGFFVDHDYTFTATWYDSPTNKLFLVSGTNGDILEWNVPTQPSATMQWKSKTIITKDFINLGAARVIADYTDVTTIWDTTLDNWEASAELWNTSDEVTFQLYANKQLIFTRTLNSDDTFRMPTGYKTDTFEVSVQGNVRIRAIHLGSTPRSLATA